MIIERTQAGKEIACTKDGLRERPPPIDQKRKNFAVDLILNQHNTYREVVELTRLSKSALTRSINAYRVKIALEGKSVD